MPPLSRHISVKILWGGNGSEKGARGGLRRFIGSSVIVAVALVFAAPPAISATSWLEQKLREVDRNICQNYQSVKCKARKAKTAKAVKPESNREPEVQAAEPAPPVEGEVVAPTPRMKPKPSAPAETVIAKSPPPPADDEPVEEVVPVPRRKPTSPQVATIEEEVEPKASQPVEAEIEAEAPLPIPKPRAKPKGAVRVVVAAPPEVEDQPPPKRVTGNDNCLASLALLKVKFNVITKPVGKGACRVKDPVELVAQTIDDNTVVFPDKPTLTCGFAVQFAKWMTEKGEPIASDAGTHVAKFYTGPGYQCRGRNGDGSAKISEHGYGNAIDIERMEMAKGKLVMVGEGNQRVVQAMRKSACGYFTTVLGPGSNAAHARHLHFDMGKHGRSGTYKICE